MRIFSCALILALIPAPAFGQGVRPQIVGYTTGGTAMAGTFSAREFSLQFAKSLDASPVSTRTLNVLPRALRWRVAYGRVWMFAVYGSLPVRAGPEALGQDDFHRLSLANLL